MTWKDVKTSFTKEFTEQYCTIDDNSVVTDEIDKYKNICSSTNTIYLSHFSGGTAKQRCAKSRINEEKKTINISTKRSGRTDKGMPHSRKKQAAFVEKFIVNQWENGDPATRESIAEALRVYVVDNPDDELEYKYSNKEFKKSVLSQRKKTSLSQFITRCMNRIGFSNRKCCIGQAVPDDWYEQAIAAAKDIRETFKNENVDVVVNADQTFVNFHPESNYVIAPTNSR